MTVRGGLGETSAVPPGRAGSSRGLRPQSPQYVKYWGSLRPCLAAPSAPWRRDTFRRALLGVRGGAEQLDGPVAGGEREGRAGGHHEQEAVPDARIENLSAVGPVLERCPEDHERRAEQADDANRAAPRLAFHHPRPCKGGSRENHDEPAVVRALDTVQRQRAGGRPGREDADDDERECRPDDDAESTSS